eukprot:TRINITY_DN45907_c0_g1_i1.p1 TRINITY_DN45907_c0_g1~~TRINITY_DN45907_c0_g1_i1.p1  ORF type:complete len:461 (-),score=65.19 TRINITY_DN45907_c0_g1_i1:136-1419(-)
MCIRDSVKTVSLGQKGTIMAWYQFSSGIANSHIVSSLYVDGQATRTTRSIAGNGMFGTVSGVWFGELDKGMHRFSVKFRSPATIGFTGTDYETRSLTIVALTDVRSQEAMMVEWASDTDVNPEGWSLNDVTQTTYGGKLHGMWGAGVPAKKTYQHLPRHSKIQIRARYWAIDTWDRNEAGYLKVDGMEQWRAKKQSGSCGPEFQSYQGANNRCYQDITALLAHTGQSLTLEFGSSISQAANDESYGFGSVQISIDGSCSNPGALGVEDNTIPNGRVTASSFYQDNPTYGPNHGRLNHGGHGWISKTNDQNQWLQVDLGTPTTVTAVATQGRPDAVQWVSTYKLLYSSDGKGWSQYLNGETIMGNSDQNSVVTHSMKQPFMAQYVRFNPRTWNSHMVMRVEVYGCTDSYGIDGGGCCLLYTSPSPRDS